MESHRPKLPTVIAFEETLKNDMAGVVEEPLPPLLLLTLTTLMHLERLERCGLLQASGGGHDRPAAA